MRAAGVRGGRSPEIARPQAGAIKSLRPLRMSATERRATIPDQRNAPTNNGLGSRSIPRPSPHPRTRAPAHPRIPRIPHPRYRNDTSLHAAPSLRSVAAKLTP